MSESQFPIGRRITLPGHFAEPVALESVRPLGDGCECRVRLADGSLEEVVLSPAETLLIRGHDGAADKPHYVEALDVQLLVESARIRLAYVHDRQFAVSLSGIRTLPHQIEAVYQKMLPQPCLRFLLADDPGAGKTIMAGLLIKELKLREAVDRVLILCPAPLTIQWQDELQRWFGETFDIIFAAVDQQQLSNPWQRSNQVIASLDYAKQDDVRERIWQQHWNLVIIDEAHKCSARTGSGGVGREPKIVSTRRYDLAAKLSSQCDNLLLLTATPHHGDEDKFAHFLRLIDNDLFPEPHRLGPQASELRNDVFRLGTECPWALRRLKEDLKDMDGQRLFPDRHAVTVPFKLNADEFSLYKAVTAYINEFIPQQQGQRRTSAALARTVLQRRLASSACAIHESLKRRLQKQQNLLDELEQLTPAQRSKRLATHQGRLVDSEQEEDDLDDADRDQLIDEYTAAIELDQLRAEIAALKDLVEQARRVRESANDSKLKALKSCLERAQFADLTDGRGKLLLFTEHRDTMNYVKEHLTRWGYRTCEIHGGMNPHERKRAQEQFRAQAQVCVATEAAGEGINLQFCHLMINYDMPWNPTRLEQRLGRIHRIGQRDDCYAFNFVATSGEDGDAIVEGRILERLLEKLETMKASLAGRVFDVIGEVLSLNDVNLPEMLREAAVDPRRLDDYLDQIDRINPDKLREYEKATGIALARGHVDFSGFQQRNLEIEERRLMPKYVEDQFIAAALGYCDNQMGRVIDEIDGLGQLDNTLVIYVQGDNGASAEGSLQGTTNEIGTAVNGVPEDLPYLLSMMDKLGSDRTYNHYPVGWAHAMDSPLQWTKQVASHFGGTRNGMVISWPKRIKAHGEIRPQFHHVIDVVPTILEAAGIPMPESIDGVKQKPIEGVSMVYSFDDAKAKDRHTTQYFEMLGNRGLYHDGWMACTTPLRLPWLNIGSTFSPDDFKWELYHVDQDFSQADNLAAANPEKLKELQDVFDAEAKKYNVYPLDSSAAERADPAIRPSLTRGRNVFTYYPGMIRIPEGTTPDVKNKPFSISADVEIPEGGASGVLATQGGRFAGWGLLVMEGKPLFVYSYSNQSRHKFRVGSDEKLSPGKPTILFDFGYDGGGVGRGGTGTLKVDGKKVAQGRIERTVPFRFSADETFDVGEDTGTPVIDDYDDKMPFRFTGALTKLVIQLKPGGSVAKNPFIVD